MAFYLDIFSPETYEAYSKSDKSLTGFRKTQEQLAQKIMPGDKLISYVTRISRWVGILEVTSKYFIDESPRFFEIDDPFIIRFTVKPLIWLDLEKAIPIKDGLVWNSLSFTRGMPKTGSQWTGKLRASLNRIDEIDGIFLETALTAQANNGTIYPIEETEYKKLLPKKIRGTAKEISVTIPEDGDDRIIEQKNEISVRESIKIQALLGKIGETLGFSVWIPRADQSRVLHEWTPSKGTLLDSLPLNYNEATNKTIEQIDVLWLDRRYIVRAFEVEHTTSIYSGILRMADLMALQPNLEIKLHIVAPTDRRDKVLDEIRRPVFSLLGRHPLSEMCTFISYDSLNELATQKHLSSMKDNVLEDYEEAVD